MSQSEWDELSWPKILSGNITFLVRAGASKFSTHLEPTDGKDALCHDQLSEGESTSDA